MDRRDFLNRSLRYSAAAALMPALPNVHQSLARFQLGYAAITWGGNDLAAIDDIAAAGWRGIQLRASAVQRWGKEPDALRELLARKQLEFIALSSGVVSADPAREADTIAQHTANAEFLKAAGGKYLQIVDERPRGRALTPDDYRRMGRLLTEIGQRTADLGVALGYHNHMGNLGQAPDEVARVLDAADSRVVRLQLDIAHWKAAGGDPVQAVHEYADRLLFLHLKDLVRPGLSGAAGSYRFVELGEGSVDVRGVLQALDRIGFAGWCIVELDDVTDRTRTPRDCALTSQRFLERAGYPLTGR